MVTCLVVCVYVTIALIHSPVSSCHHVVRQSRPHLHRHRVSLAPLPLHALANKLRWQSRAHASLFRPKQTYFKDGRTTALNIGTIFQLMGGSKPGLRLRFVRFKHRNHKMPVICE